MKNYHWVGPRSSDIKHVFLFDKSTTIFGDGIINNTAYSFNNGHRVNHNIVNPIVDAFFIEKLTKEIELNPDIKLMHYNPYFAYDYGELIISHSICMNKQSLLVVLQEKMETRIWMSNYCNTIPSIVLPLKACNENDLKKIFPYTDNFVIQKNISSGGFGTRILNYKQSDSALDGWDSNEELIVTPYLYPSVPINIHIVIFKKEILILPPSIQLICPDCNGRLIYKGADYAAYYSLNENVKKSVLNNADVIGEQLRKYGYLGVAGIDFIFHNDILYFLEVNPRFQASTSLLNKALIAQGLSTVQEMNLEAFKNEMFSCKIPNINIRYSNFCYDSNNIVAKHILNCCKDNVSVDLDLDGYDGRSEDENVYQFRVNFPYNIASVNPDGYVNIHDNILGSLPIQNVFTQRTIMQIKIELLNQGIVIKPTAMDYINQMGIIRSGVFDSVDITIFGNVKINCPYKIKLSEFSPYNIDIDNNILLLKRYEQTISIISIDLADNLSNCKTSNNIEYHTIATLAADRVRINHTNICRFKLNVCSCAFCNLPEYNATYHFEDICEVIDDYLKNSDFKHFLIGGGSCNGSIEIKRIIKIAKYIKQNCNKPIYVMCLPPKNHKLVEMLYEAEINEIAFNIEIFDRKIARQIMPGKGLIPLQRYYNRLRQAVNLWGRNGNVKSLIILGLEPQKSLMQGIETLCNMGVQPVLSAFRPLKGTLFEEVIPMSTNRILDIYFQAEKICNKNELYLGPSCFQCQNNTVSFHPEHLSSLCSSDFQVPI
jgi:biotin synthase-related radical SAM superfamily protein